MRSGLAETGCAILGCALSVGCAAAQTSVTASPTPPARVAFTSDRLGIAVQLRSVSNPTASASSCSIPCTLLTVPGPAKVTVSQAESSVQREVLLVPGDQRLNVSPGNSTLRTLGWIGVAASVVALGTGIYALTYFKSDGPAPEGESPTPGWAKTTATASLLSIVPLGLVSLVLLSEGTTKVDSVPVGTSARATGWPWCWRF